MTYYIRTNLIMSCIRLFISLSLLACFVFPPAFSTSVLDNSFEIDIIQSTTERLVFNVYVPSFTVAEKDGHIFHIPGFSQTASAGEPQLPVHGVTFAIPFGSQAAIQVGVSASKTYSSFNIPPAPEFEPRIQTVNSQSLPVVETTRRRKNADIYAKNAFYPDAFVSLDSTAVLRDQHIQFMRIFPIRYNPVSGIVRHAEHLRVSVQFQKKDDLRTSSSRIESPVYEKTFENILLNKNAAPSMRSHRKKLSRRSSSGLSKQRYKIHIKRPGVYVLNYNQLASAGLPLDSIDPKTFRLYNKGEQVAIHVHGEQDGRFDGSDYIEFIGSPAQNYYENGNVYWLTFDDSPGRRMKRRDGRLQESDPVIDRGVETWHLEKDSLYINEIPVNEKDDHWFWRRVISGQPFRLPLHLTDVADVSFDSCSIRVGLFGYTYVPSIAPDHLTTVFLNSEKIGSGTWDGQRPFEVKGWFPQSALRNGQNEIKIDVETLPDVAYDFQLLDEIKVRYMRSFSATNDSMAFSAEAHGRYRIRVSNWPSDVAHIYNITDPRHAVRIDAYQISSNTLEFADSLSGEEKYLVVSSFQKREPDFIEKTSPPDLSASHNQADYILITHDRFTDQARTMADFRRSQGLTAMVVDVQDIYDQFNHGLKDPRAIKDFLHTAFHQWRAPAPVYVLLLGDASYDFKDHTGNGVSDFVPTHLFLSNTYSFETASDSWFATVSGHDMVPDMHVGRLSVRTTGQAEKAVTDIIDYAKHSDPEPWQKNVLFISDDTDNAGDFEHLTDELIQKTVSDAYHVKKITAAEFDTESNAQKTVMDSLDAGAVIANYMGHGSMVSWAANPRLFHVTDVMDMNNGHRMPLVFTQSCINGYFIYPDAEQRSLGEELLIDGDNGALAVYTGSGFAYLSATQTLALAFYRSIFDGGNAVIGPSTIESKVALLSAHPGKWDHAAFYILFGDPASELHLQPIDKPAPATYNGRITISDEPAPVGTQIFATLYQQHLDGIRLQNDDGSFQEFTIPADDPATNIRDGAAEGDSIYFNAVLPQGDSLQLDPAVVWHSGANETLHLSGVLTGVNQSRLSVDMWLNEKRVSDQRWSEDPVPRNARFSAKIKTFRIERQSPTVELYLDQHVIPSQKYSFKANDKEPKNYDVSFQLPKLADGEHRLLLKIKNKGDVNAIEKKVIFYSQSSLNIDRALAFPNPMQEETAVSYRILNDSPADVTIKIYSLAGRLLKTIQTAGGEVGFNSTLWDGCDKNGDRLANGVYLVRINAREHQEKAAVLTKVIIMN